MVYSLFELAQFKQVFDDMRGENTENPEEIKRLEEFSQNVGNPHSLNEAQLKAVDDICLIFLATTIDPDISAALKFAALASLCLLADKGFAAAQEGYIESMAKDGRYNDALTFANKLLNAADSREGDNAKGQSTFDRISKCTQNVLGTWSKELSEKIVFGVYSEEGLNAVMESSKWMEMFSKSEGSPEWKQSQVKLMADTFNYVLAREAIPPEVKVVAETSLKLLAIAGYPEAQDCYAMQMKRTGNFEEAYNFWDKFVHNDKANPEQRSIMDYSFERLLTKWSEETRKGIIDSLGKGDAKGLGEALGQYVKLLGKLPDREGPKMTLKYLVAEEMTQSFVDVCSGRYNVPEALNNLAESSLKQLAGKGYAVAQEGLTKLLEGKGRSGNAGEHEKGGESSLKKTLLNIAGSKSTINIIKASQAFAQTGLDLAGTVLDAGVKVADKFVEVPDLGIGRGLKGVLSKGIDVAADVGISLAEAARRKAEGR